MTGIMEAYVAYSIMLGLLFYHAKTLISEIKSLKSRLDEFESLKLHEEED